MPVGMGTARVVRQRGSAYIPPVGRGWGVSVGGGMEWEVSGDGNNDLYDIEEYLTRKGGKISWR